MGSDFIPGPSNFLGSTSDTTMVDEEWAGSGCWYKVSAVDTHGNVSPYALLEPETVSGADGNVPSQASFASPNYPNPFNPSTAIRYGLQEPAHVSLRVYDSPGRLVRFLVDEAMPSGIHTAVWDGRNSAGREVASGVYFFRMSAGHFEVTRKMTLVR